MGVRFDKGNSNKYIERVPNELLVMDVDASRGLAATVAGWPSHAEEVRSIVTDAEVLADMPLGVVASLDEIGRDGTAMAGRDPAGGSLTVGHSPLSSTRR